MTFGQKTVDTSPRSRRRLWMAMGGVAVLIGSMSGAAFVLAPSSSPASVRLADRHPVQHRRPADTVRSTPASPWVPAFGVYAGPGAVSAAQAFDVQIGAPVPYALDYLDDSSWGSISDPQWTLQQWTVSQFHMIFGVPMLPESGGSLAIGATGAYDSEFTSLATHLIAAGDGNAVLMIGWDPLQDGMAWQVSTTAEAADYVAYWRHIVETLRAVPGANFLFEWDGEQPSGSLAPSAVYPGNSYVNLIATNVFDQLATPVTDSRWDALATATYGPDWFSQFASDHDKPLVVGEWGLVPASAPGGAGDDPAFVRDFTRWCADHRVALIVTWDFGAWGLSSGSFPASVAALVVAGGAGSSGPALALLSAAAKPGSGTPGT